MLAIFFYLLLGFLVYSFVFRFLIPIIRATRQVKRSFRAMREQMGPYGDPNAAQNGAGAAQRPNVSAQAPSKEDYIDFEEIKD